MLVLSRRPQEKIVIGKEITVTVLKVRGNKVFLGIEAPKSQEVYRLEVFLERQKDDENRERPQPSNLSQVYASNAV